MTLSSVPELLGALERVASIRGDGLEVADEARFREQLVGELADAAVFGEPDVRESARWVVWAASQALGCGSTSIHELYLARGRGEFDATSFTVPAINARASTYLTARRAFRTALERDAAALVFEIAKSEMAYTN